ncbi:MAG: Fe-S cluster assembly protein SufD, partial [Acidobacteriota bacterium]
HPRVLVLAGAGSQLHLVEEFAGRGRYFVNSVTDILLRPGAVVVHEKIVQESRTGGHVGAVRVRQENDSVFSSVNLSRAPGLVRNDLHVALSGKGADCTLSGMAWGEDDGHVDHHTVVDHAQPRCTSRQLYKGVLDGCSRGVFCGRVVVRPGAQKTSAWQTSKNLLLSADALASSIPQLEINADDVQCRHGSAIGQMDENMLFYLQSRGIAAQDARQVLTLAFACEILDRLRLPELRSRLHHQLLSGGAGKPDPAAGVEAM